MTEFEKFIKSPVPVTLSRLNCPGFRWIPVSEGETEVLMFGAFWHNNKVYFTDSNNKTILSESPERKKEFLNGVLYYTRSIHEESFGKLYFIVEEISKSVRVGNKKMTIKKRK